MKRLRITVDDRTYDVTVEVLSDETPHLGSATVPQPATPRAAGPTPVAPASTAPKAPVAAGGVTSPMAGVVKTISVKAGDTVKQGDELLILEAMKMDNRVAAPRAGTVSSIEVSQGDSVQEGQVLVVLG